MNSTLKKIIGEYRQILIKDGLVSKDELIKMLNLDDEIQDEYKTEISLNKIADKILDNRLSPEKQALYEQRMKLYKQGFSNADIARVENIQPSNISRWLKDNNLKPNTLSNKEKDKIRTELYYQGYKDNEIAEKVGVKLTAITNWRIKKGFRTNGKRPMERTRK